MRRRAFIALVSGVALASPLAARAQKPMPVIGFLSAFSRPAEYPTPQFRQGLADVGYVEGRNITFEQLFADGQYDRLSAMAADLVGRRVAAIVAFGFPAAKAAQAATTTIPIVFWSAGDPIADGLVASLSHPGGNLTGVATFNNVLGAKRLELLRELVPKAAAFAILVNPANASAAPQLKEAQDAARTLGVRLDTLSASTDAEVETAFTTLANSRADGLIVASDPYLFSRRDRLVKLAAQHAVPTIYTVRAYALAGGLISYTSNPAMEYERAVYIGRILNGEKPADLPVQQPAKFELVVNLKAAKALGLTLPQSILARADEVIE